MGKAVCFNQHLSVLEQNISIPWQRKISALIAQYSPKELINDMFWFDIAFSSSMETSKRFRNSWIKPLKI